MRLLIASAALVAAGLALAQPPGEMGPGSGSGSTPGTGATNPGYGDAPLQAPRPDSGSTGGDDGEARGSIGAGEMERGGSVPSDAQTGTTLPRR